MNSILILAAATALGVEAGWQPLPEGGHEYTIQLEPQLLDVLRRGSDIVSEVPPQIDVRRYRITIGTGSLARVDGQPAARGDHRGLASPAQPSEPQEHAGDLPRDEAGHPPAQETNLAEDSHPAAPGHTAAPTEARTVDEPGQSAGQPAALPADTGPSHPIGDAQPAAHHVPVQEHNTEKPAIDATAGDAAPKRPWLPLSLAVVLLCCSLGANVYLGWLASEARQRYRQVAAKLRGATS